MQQTREHPIHRKRLQKAPDRGHRLARPLCTQYIIRLSIVHLIQAKRLSIFSNFKVVGKILVKKLDFLSLIKTKNIRGDLKNKYFWVEQLQLQQLATTWRTQISEQLTFETTTALMVSCQITLLDFFKMFGFSRIQDL